MFSRAGRSWVLAAALVFGSALAFTPAAARDLIIAPPFPPPGRVWIEPVYRIVMEQVWIEGHYDRIADRAWVPPCYERRPVEVWEDGHYVIREELIEISPGYWTTTYREVWAPGHYEWRERRILVTPGHWEPPYPEPVPLPLPAPRINPPSVPVEGYQPGGSGGPSPFTPLYDWPK